MCIRDRSIGELGPISGTAAVPPQPEFETQPVLEEDIDEGNERPSEMEDSDPSLVDDPADESPKSPCIARQVNNALNLAADFNFSGFPVKSYVVCKL